MKLCPRVKGPPALNTAVYYRLGNGTVFIFVFRLLDRAPAGPVFIALCFLVRAVDAIGFAASITASFSILAKAFPNNIATVLVMYEASQCLGDTVACNIMVVTGV